MNGHGDIKEVREVEVLSPRNLTKTAGKVKEDLPPYWDREYVVARINAIPDHKDRMLCTFLWRTGLRITEAISLRKADLDFQNYVMRARWLKSRKYQTRMVPMHPSIRDLLQVYTAQLKAEDRVFPITRQRAWQITQRWLEGNPHKLRHSFAVNWLRCEGDIVTLHRILGHAKIETTMHYLRIVPVDQGRELLKIRFD